LVAIYGLDGYLVYGVDQHYLRIKIEEAPRQFFNASGNLPPDRKRNDRQGGDSDHKPRQGNRCRHCENGESAAEQSKPHRHTSPGQGRVWADVMQV
jgi:hypothetical protein